MQSNIYLIWALLPISLFLLALWGIVKRAAKQRGREYPADNFRQGIYCLVLLFVAVWLDQQYLSDIASDLASDDLAASVIRLLIYPAVLLIAAMIQKKVKGK